jgi:hypothetical protein
VLLLMQVYHHNAVGFDEFLGELIYDKSEDLQPSVLTTSLKPKNSSSRGSQPYVECGQIVVEVATSRQLGSL